MTILDNLPYSNEKSVYACNLYQSLIMLWRGHCSWFGTGGQHLTGCIHVHACVATEIAMMGQN